ncbi:undecaprenyl-diphosphate phosphatase [Pseudonocardia benzenivorans]|uniref:Undecaprenyl-diphosphatase n=1 Tax=Pseudonocardia benzenivorans TaxID=228005 RepID=A0ABW3VEJ0_9PSEU|nr:undecaprenyl-diphosphatase [Pseudonocardia sp. D17]
MSTISYLEAVVVGALQGVSELFPVSSLGHSVLVPALVGGRWATDLSVTRPGSPYLAVLVAMHVATALALVVHYRRDWVRIVGGLWESLRRRRITSPIARIGVLLVLGTIPVGIAGLILEAPLRDVLGKPIPAALFLAVNGLVLWLVERGRRAAADDSAAAPTPSDDAAAPQGATVDFSAQPTLPMHAVAPGRAGVATAVSAEDRSDARVSRLGWRDALVVGGAQSLALLPGISRSGITMVAALRRGLRHDDAARFAFLLATPVILAAGLLKMPSLFTAAERPVLGPALVGSLVAGVAAYLSARFLSRWFHTGTLRPFAVYCVVAGLGSLAYLGLFAG